MKAHWRQIGVAVVTLAVLVVLNGLVYQKERLLADGRTVYLELAGEDARSLMQGDYIELRYAIGRAIDEHRNERETHGRIVASLDDRNVARFERRWNGGELGDDEIVLQWRYRGRVAVGANAYFIEEGNADAYAEASYAEIRAGDDGETVLLDVVETPEDGS